MTAGMRSAEWIHVVVLSSFTVLAQVRELPCGRRRKATRLGVAGLAATLAGAFLAPALIRDWLPAALMLVTYQQAGAFFVRVDEKVQTRLLRIDAIIAAPLLRWLFRTRAGTVLTFCVEFAYLFCYPLIPICVAAIYLFGISAHVDQFWLVVLTATYTCYCMLPFVQTLPPRMLDEAWLPPHPRSPVRRLNLWILRNGSIHANTFPSAHVAASTAAALVLFGITPLPVGIAFAAIATGIAFGTFVGRYHYASDAILGSAVAAVAFALFG